MKQILIGATALSLVATPVLAAGDAACRSVATAMRSLSAAPYDPSSDLIAGPMQRLAAKRGAGVSLDLSKGLTAEQVQVLPATLKSRFGASAAVLKAVDDLDPDSGAVSLLRMGGSDVYAVEVTAGTMDC